MQKYLRISVAAPLMWLTLILLLALIIRLPGQFYPLSVHADEGANLRRVINCFPPCGTFHHPFLERYLLFLAESANFIVGLAIGTFRSIDDFKVTWLIAPQTYLYWGRSVSLLAALGTIWATWRLGRAAADSRVGLVGALMIALSPMHMMVSANLSVWSLSALMSTLSILAMLPIDNVSTRRHLALVGMLIGAAVSTVYPMALLVLPLLVLLTERWRKSRKSGGQTGWLGDILAVGTTALGVFVVVNLQIMSDLRRLMRDLQATTDSDLWGGGEPVGYLTNVSWYIDSLWDPFALGPVITLLALLGLLRFVWSGSPRLLALAAFATAILLVQPVAMPLWSARYAVPVYPVLAVAASALIIAIADRLGAASRLGHGRWPLLLTSLIALPSGVAAVDLASVLMRTPTRELARQWIEREIPAGKRIAINHRYVAPQLAQCETILASTIGRAMTAPCYHIDWLERGQDNRDFLAATGADYFIHTDAVPPAMRTRLRKGTSVPPQRASGMIMAAEFWYPDLDRFIDDTVNVNPKIRIYRTDASSPLTRCARTSGDGIDLIGSAPQAATCGISDAGQ